MSLNYWFAYLHLLSAKITGTCHHAQLTLLVIIRCRHHQACVSVHTSVSHPCCWWHSMTDVYSPCQLHDWGLREAALINQLTAWSMSYLDSSSAGWGKSSWEGLSTSTELRWMPAHKVLWLGFASGISQPARNSQTIRPWWSKANSYKLVFGGASQCKVNVNGCKWKVSLHHKMLCRFLKIHSWLWLIVIIQPSLRCLWSENVGVKKMHSV